ncbi:dimethyladenosine transferase (rRNA methylation) [Corynebacterium mustelae]|uniref:Dimethyladenosine transferase (RRNA methylation) n=1 Tax=Corynebacterium mustelae TaxID=571915 RepID=A0A0G3GVK6_9CORY|nr:23S ribosomal RNA methyltransferase Erm [Corynebacterium mustelae]AKK05164.1 dimethyladenosine transferase (rRNA methylation) [Corynebacterium mustelae]
MSAYGHGRHEHGQNFLTDHKTINTFVDVVAQTTGPIVEIGPGRGALTFPITRLGRSVTAIEVDTKLATRLKEKSIPGCLEIVHRDFLTFRLPATPHVIVGNIPFHITTAILRKLLHAPHWRDAVLLMQWEVARRRAGIGGNTLMTAQWAPWFGFRLVARVPRSAFSPQPNVDGGILVIHRKENPEIPIAERKVFQTMVHAVFTGKGRGIGEILSRLGLFTSKSEAHMWLRSRGIKATTFPPKVDVNDWIDLFQVTGGSPPRNPSGPTTGSRQRRSGNRRNRRRKK